MCSVTAAAPGGGCLFTPAGSGGRGGSLLHSHFATEPLHQSGEAEIPHSSPEGAGDGQPAALNELQPVRAQCPQEDDAPNSIL